MVGGTGPEHDRGRVGVLYGLHTDPYILDSYHVLPHANMVEARLP